MSLRPACGAPWGFALLLLGFGIILSAGGAELVAYGGSFYYLVTGLVLIADAMLLWRGRRAGLWVYAGWLAYTILWSLWDAGLDGWALASRIASPIILGLYLLLPHCRRGLA